MDSLIHRGHAVEAEGRVVKQIGGRGWYASVRLSFVPGAGREIVLAASAVDEWQRSEGWLDAATTGAALGLELARASGRCSISCVHGMVVDTSPGVVALAAIRAVWAALGFAPSDSLAVAVKNCITRAHQLSVEALRVELTAVANQAEQDAAGDGGGMSRF